MLPKKLDTILQNFKYNIRLTGVTRVYFNKSEWESSEPPDKVSWQYLLYRAVYCVYFIVWLIINICKSDSPHFWMIMATNWSFLIQTIYGTVYFSNLAYRYVQYRRLTVTNASNKSKELDVETPTRQYIRSPTQLNIFDSITWLLLNIAGTVPYIVSLGYWFFVYGGNDKRGIGDIFLNLTAHGFNAILALIDTFVIAIPIRVAHGLYTILFAFVYLLFSLIYEHANGAYPHFDPNLRDCGDDSSELYSNTTTNKPYIYKFLNWHCDPGMTVVHCLIALVAAMGFHIGLWFLFRFRMYLVPRLRGPNLYSVKT